MMGSSVVIEIWGGARCENIFFFQIRVRWNDKEQNETCKSKSISLSLSLSLCLEAFYRECE